LLKELVNKGSYRKNLPGLFIKVFEFYKGFLCKAKSPMVLSKRSLIHSNSFQPKIYSCPKLFLVGVAEREDQLSHFV
jgi:hypothetical protein